MGRVQGRYRVAGWEGSDGLAWQGGKRVMGGLGRVV